VEELREAYTLFDESGDGKISVREMKVILRSLGQNPRESEIKDLMKSIGGGDGCEETDFEGFLKLMRKKLNEPEMDEEMFEAFKTFDKEGKGYYDVNEMREVLAQYGEKLTEQEAQQLFRDIDLNGDGKIEFEDFVYMMMAK
jgi:calmodulin